MSDAGSGWAQVHVEVEPALAEVVADALWAAGASAVEERPGDERTLLIADCPADAARGLVPDGVEVVEIALDDGWRDTWRAHASSTRVDDGFVVHLVGAERIDRPGDLVLELEPGHAFGTGSHPTTLACLRRLRTDCPPAGLTVLDLGCGSGTLAVAAAMLGAAHVVALDVDLEAEAMTNANATANGVTVEVVPPDVGALIPGTFQLVLANIGGRVLRELADDITRACAPGATLVLAGLLEHQLDETVRAFPAFEALGTQADDGWTCPVLRKIA